MLRWGMILLFLPCVLLIGHYLIEVQDAAKCTQNQGSWDYLTAHCDFKQVHEFIPYSVRYSVIVNIGMAISIIGLIMGTLGMLQKGMAKDKGEV